jgi:predicted nucleic acid-binding protein
MDVRVRSASYPSAFVQGVVKVVFDTNILVDYLQGIESAREELARYERPGISLITWMEVLIGAQDNGEDRLLRRFLDRFETLEIGEAVAEQAVQLRKARRMRLPDAIIWATAKAFDRLLVTRNTRDFPVSDPGVRVPYRI